MFGLLESLSSFSDSIDQLFLLITLITIFWFFVAQFVFLYFILRYRKKKNPRASYIGGTTHKEMKVPHWLHNAILGFDVIIVALAMWVWFDVKHDMPAADETIRVTGYQWTWVFQHPGKDGQLHTADDIRLVDELHVQEGKTYHFELTSNDVLHNFSVPVFRLKQDAVPGRIIRGWFKPTGSGTYDVQCAEICGIGHGAMSAKIHIYDASGFQKWLDTAEDALPTAHLASAN